MIKPVSRPLAVLALSGALGGCTKCTLGPYPPASRGVAARDSAPVVIVEEYVIVDEYLEAPGQGSARAPGS